MTSAHTSVAGELVAGRYRLLRELGAGAMGSVWRAYDERLERRVALKWVRPVPESEQTETLRQRVLREGRIAARLQHPNVVAVYDVVEDDGGPVLVMEYLRCTSLAELVAEEGPLPVARVADIGARVASALAAAHAAGIVHRDVKPGNILMSDEGVKIGDFGIAHANGDATITATGVIAGTPTFLAPETVHGRRPLPRSDVFSLGATLYAAVEGVPPFGRDLENPYAVLFRIASGEMREPVRAGALAPVLKAMMAPVPADRPAAEEVAESLRAIAEGRQPAAARTLSLPRPRRPRALWPPRKPGKSPRAHVFRARRVAVVLLALVTLVVLLSFIRRVPPADTSAPEPAAAAVISPAQLENSVSAYYARLPGDPAAAWTLLAPARRIGGLPAFERQWQDVAALTVTAPPHAENGLVTVGVAETLDDGTVVRETHRIAFDGTLLDADTVMSGERTAPVTPPPPTVTVAEQQAVVEHAPITTPDPAVSQQPAPPHGAPPWANAGNGRGRGRH